MPNGQSLVLLLLFGGLLLLMFNRTRRQQREAQNLQTQLTVGSRIMTTAGLYATVVELDDTQVTLETAPGQHSRWDRRAIARIVPDEPAGAGESPADGDAERPAGDAPPDGGAATAPSPDSAPPDRA